MKILSDNARGVLGDSEVVDLVNIVSSREDGRPIWKISLKGSRGDSMSICVWEFTSGAITIDEVYNRLVELKGQ